MSVEAAKFDGVVENNAFIFWNFLLSGKAAEEVILGPGDEEGFLVVNPTEPGEVGVALVEAVDAVRDDGKFFSGNGNLMAFAIGDGEERRDLAGIVQAIMELDGSLGGAELGPGEGGEAEIDDGCIQQVERIFEPEPMLRRHGAAAVKQTVKKFLVNPVVPVGIGIGQGRLCDAGRQAEVVEMSGLRGEPILDVAKTVFTAGLSVEQDGQLVPGGESLDVAVAVKGFNLPVPGLL